MAGYRKLGKRNDIRENILRNLTTQLIVSGQVKTTVTRAKEVQKIAEKLITSAALEADNFTTKEILVSEAKKDKDGKKVLKDAKSLAGNDFYKVERELSTKEVQVDEPSRLAARRRALNVLYRAKDEDDNQLNPVNILFNEIGPRFKGHTGGYTRIIPTGTRRGDSAEMCVPEIIDAE